MILAAQQRRAQAAAPAPNALPTGVVRGRVTSTDARPVANAQVVLIGTLGADSLSTMTDRDGRFEFRDVVAGAFHITANKLGYARGDPGRLVTPDSTLEAGLGLDLPQGKSANGST